ncbi:MAG TPA: glycosyltransferase family 2 protein [Blastocatellia bacterium]|jgi:glycosyltransferase involved in cell wall biosynthesis|nr:glycosyltransferase family 2 protein [Blastocatellia bacterium]
MVDNQIKRSGPARSISVVIPLLNESDSLEELHARLSPVLTNLATRYEIIFIDDGSTDDSIEVLKELRARDKSVKYIRFRRNFGKSAALAAGFSAARYEIIVTMDADLQDLPDQLPLLLGKLEEGYDLVSGWRFYRKDRLTKRMASRLYNKVTSILTGVRLHDINCGFKCYKKEVLDEVMIYGERHRYIPVLASYRGFRLGEVKIDHAPRAYGSSRYGFGRVSGGVFSLLTVILLTRYTNKPLHFFGVMGMSLAGVGTLIDSYLIFMRVFFQEWLSNRPLLIIGTLLVIVGMQLVLFGLLAEMIAFSYRRENDYSIVETSEDDEARTQTGRGIGVDARAQPVFKENSGR